MRSLLTGVVIYLLCAGAAPAADVLLVQGTLSAPDDAEQNYARRLTETFDRWLTELHLPHIVVTEEALSSRKLRSAEIVMLIYSPYPPAREIELLQHFVARGGKLIVFYSAEPKLADLMGMRLGAYQVEQSLGAWRAFKFHGSLPAGLPPRIIQASRNIRPVYAIEGKSQVLAEWEDQEGKLTGDPAWVKSDQGFWMTHVLLDDGDTWNKKCMLLALLGACDPDLWPLSAGRLLARAGTLGKFNDLQDAVRNLMNRAAGTKAEKEISRILSRARSTYLQALTARENEAHADVLAKAHEIDELLVKAYCRLVLPRQPPVIGVWNHSGQGLYPGDWPRTCRFLKAHQVTDIFPNIANPSRAHHASSVVPQSYVFRTLGDQLTQCIAAAHKSGLKAHAWKICWRLDRPTPEELKKLKADGRLQITRAGRAIPWLCPSVASNRILEKDAIREIVRNYNVDGIHLDYIRYADAQVCYCKTCRKEFEKQIGKPLLNWPEVVGETKLKRQFTEWRAGQITRFVRDVSVLSKKIRPGIQISAAVYGRYPLCIASVGQDWGSWLRQEYIDFVCPMNYTSDADRFAQWTEEQLSLPGADGRVYPGIGVTATESKLTPVQVADQIAALTQQGAAGFILFDLNRKLELETLPALRMDTPTLEQD